MATTIHTLWTGGLDSTARIVYLSKQRGIIIQPYYVIDKDRVSTPIEIEAMKSITNRLRNDKSTSSEIKDVIIISTDEIESNSEITNAWLRLNQDYGVGSQYDFLARYAIQHDITLEIGIENGDGRAQTAIRKESRMVQTPLDVTGGGNFWIDRNLDCGDVWTLFNKFTFPLWETSKAKEIEMLKELGCEDIVEMTWFCHTPLFGKPCGHCNPCKDAYHYNLGWRIPRINYYLWYLMRPKQALKSISHLLKHSVKG